MAVEAEQPQRGASASQRRVAPLEALAASTRALADSTTLTAMLDAIVHALAGATGSELALVRVLEPDGGLLAARSIATASRSLAAELERSRVPVTERAFEELDERAALPEAVHLLAERVRAGAALQVPVRVGGRALGRLELLRSGVPYDDDERLLARLAADQVAVALTGFVGPRRGDSGERDGTLELAGEALAAGADTGRAAAEIARLAVESTGARSALLWRLESAGPELAASFGDEGAGLDRARTIVVEALASDGPAAVDERGGDAVVTLQLGRPASHALQITFASEATPGEDELARLAVFGVRAAHALRASDRTRTLALDLERTRALLAAAAQSNAQLSLTHTLSTAIERVRDLLDAERIAIYLREDRRLVLAAGGPLPGPHTAVAERLLELALGPFRGRGLLAVADAATDSNLAGLEGEVAAAAIGAAVAVPLVVVDEVVGLLAVYSERGRVPAEAESALLGALAAQVAVSVQNARLHERATELTAERERDLLELQRTESNLRALYEISRAFAQSLSLDETLDAVARTVVDLLEIDAVVLRLPAGRGDDALPPTVHVADPALEGPVRALLPGRVASERRLLRSGAPLVLDSATAASLEAYRPLVPFLDKGSTAVVLPIETPTEMLGTLTMLSLDPERPITGEATRLASSVAAQAALALEKARLYEQQKGFADAMQRSLLPRSRPELPGIEVGHVYESSARVEVGGDVYDFLTLPDGRLAVVLGDVTGHGIDAAADMAMAKFVFRSLAREHPEPGDFLASANDVVCGEIASGKFITMLYLTIDPAGGEIACASGGHPAPRVIAPGGSVTPLETQGLLLGIESGQAYEETRATLEPGGAVVLYTDGVIEARRGSVQYGYERLDALLADRRGLTPDELAGAVVEDCRSFSRDELSDDIAVVVIRRREA